MTDKKNVICFIGLKTTGKDFNGKLYVEKYNFKKVSFADPLREMLWSILGFEPNEDMTYDDFKKATLTMEKPYTMLNLLYWNTDIVINTGRGLLQNLGSVMRNIDKDFWCNLWCNKVVENNSNIVCTDMRYTNEVYKALSLLDKGYNVSFVWTQYEKADYERLLKDKHESEALAIFMYNNRKKYGLYDCCKINYDKIIEICKDFKKSV